MIPCNKCRLFLGEHNSYCAVVNEYKNYRGAALDLLRRKNLAEDGKCQYFKKRPFWQRKP